MDKKIVIFAYNFPHKKTQDFLLRMNLYNIRPALMLISPPKKLNLPETFLKDKYKSIGLLHPRDICRMMDVPCEEIDHNDSRVPMIIKYHNIELGLIAGARILNPCIIKSIPMGIINYHPGLIPENRGLNTVKWAIKLNLSQGMTTHLIDEKVDRGTIINKYLIPIYDTDNLKDINMRIYDLQVWNLIMSLNFFDNSHEIIKLNGNTGYHPSADKKVDKEVLSKFFEYRNFWSIDKNGWRCKCRSKNLSFKDNFALCSDCMTRYKLIKNKEVGEILDLQLEQ